MLINQNEYLKTVENVKREIQCAQESREADSPKTQKQNSFFQRYLVIGEIKCLLIYHLI